MANNPTNIKILGIISIISIIQFVGKAGGGLRRINKKHFFLRNRNYSSSPTRESRREPPTKTSPTDARRPMAETPLHSGVPGRKGAV